MEQKIFISKPATHHLDQNVLQKRIAIAKIGHDIWIDQQEQSLWPQDLNAKQINALEQSKDIDKDLFSPFTYVDNINRQDTLNIKEYKITHKNKLKKISILMKELADLLEITDKKHPYVLRAEHVARGEFLQADAYWVPELDPNLIDIFGAYESYFDQRFGIKREFESLVMIENKEWKIKSEQVKKKYKQFVQNTLSKHGPVNSEVLRPIHVGDVLYCGGRLGGGRTVSAKIIPNWLGPRKVFLMMNTSQAVLEYSVLPISTLYGVTCTLSDYHDFVVGHELSHGLPWRFEEKLFGEYKSALEEFKADLFSIYFASTQDEDFLQGVCSAWLAKGTRAISCLDTKDFGYHQQARTIMINMMTESQVLQVENDEVVIKYQKIQDFITSWVPEIIRIIESKSMLQAKDFYNTYMQVPRIQNDISQQKLEKTRLFVTPELYFEE